MAVFCGFGSAVSSHRQAAGDHVQNPASRDPQQSKDPQQQQQASGNCSTLLRIATHCRSRLRRGEHRQEEHIRDHPRKQHQSRRRTFPLHGTRDKSLQNIMQCDDDICKDLLDNVMVVNGTDALQETSERMTKDQNAV